MPGRNNKKKKGGRRRPGGGGGGAAAEAMTVEEDVQVAGSLKQRKRGADAQLQQRRQAHLDGAADADVDAAGDEGPALQFEDPYGDEFEEEDAVDGELVDEPEEDAMAGGGDMMEEDEEGPRAVFRPGIDPLQPGEELQMDPTAYKMLHHLQMEWPCLSFDIVRDTLGGNRTRFPLTMFAVAGTQADAAESNKLTLLKLSDMHRMPKPLDEEEADGVAAVDLDGEGEDGEGEELDEDPVLESLDVAHHGGVNRVRSCPAHPHIVATCSDQAKVHVWDLSRHLASLSGAGPRPPSTAPTSRPRFTFSGHSAEGFALDWSAASATPKLATGDCNGEIRVWDHDGSSSFTAWSVEANGRSDHSASVEDLQWSPGEETVFLSCSVDRTIKVWDVRQPTTAMRTVQAHDCDVNVIAWNRNVGYLVASGADDGNFKIWDLRTFTGGAAAPNALVNYRWHTQPVTSLEWHPTDESVLAVSGDDDQLTIWDMSVEDDVGAAEENGPALPPQLLFVHQGQRCIKELHFHPQLPGVVTSTALDGFNVFKPNTNI